jgi:hypothetical protein
MKAAASAIAVLSCTYVIASAAATPHSLRGIDNDNYANTRDEDNDAAYVQLPCSYLTHPVDYEVCMERSVQGCQDENNRAFKQFYQVPTASGIDWYVCSPASQCSTTTITTTTTTVATAMPPDDSHNRNSPPGPTCAQHNQECDPDPTKLKQCCGALMCKSVERNVPEKLRSAFGSIGYACLSIRESESGGEGDYLADE